MLKRLVYRFSGPSRGLRWNSTASSRSPVGQDSPDDGRDQSEVDQELMSEYANKIDRIRTGIVQKMIDKDTYTTSDKIAELKVVRFGDACHLRPDLARLRVVPESKTFYMKASSHEDVVRSLRQLIQRCSLIPKINQGSIPLMTAHEYSSDIRDVTIGPQKYEEFRALAQQLSEFDPELLPSDVRSIVKRLRSTSAEDANGGKKRPARNLRFLDQQGRAIAVGRRKTSSARVVMVKAQENTRGQIFVNGKSLESYFPSLQHRQKIVYPLKVTRSFGEYNIWATTQGGGPSGQAGAIASAVALAVRIHNPLYIPFLAEAKCLKGDPRQKERKKYGQRGARAKYTWVKR